MALEPEPRTSGMPDKFFTSKLYPWPFYLKSYVLVFFCTDGCTTCIPSASEARRGVHFFWNWSYRRVWAALWMLGIEPRSARN